MASHGHRLTLQNGFRGTRLIVGIPGYVADATKRALFCLGGTLLAAEAPPAIVYLRVSFH